MKYFAKLDETNKVIAVHCVSDTDATTEENGINFLKHLHNYPYWKEASKDGSIRKNGAGIGMQYNNRLDAFIPKTPYTSWVFNETTCKWEPPTPRPDDGKFYDWNEETTSWDEVIR